MFGSVNQLLAALALLVVTMYLRSKGGKKYLVTAIPCALMLVMTLYALTFKEINFISAALAAARVRLSALGKNRLRLSA